MSANIVEKYDKDFNCIEDYDRIGFSRTNKFENAIDIARNVRQINVVDDTTTNIRSKYHN